MVDTCESRLELHLSGRPLRDLDLFSKSDPFAVLYIDEASSSGGWGSPAASSTPAVGDYNDEWGAVSGAPSSRSAAAAPLPPPRDRRSSLLSGWRRRPRDVGGAAGGVGGRDPPGRRASTSAVRPPSSRAPLVGRGRKAGGGSSGGQVGGAGTSSATRSWRWVGATETIRDGLNPQWVTALQVPYFFERSQHLRVEVYDRDAKAPVVPGRVDELSRHDFIGAAEVRVPEVVRAPGQRVELPLAHPRRGGGGKNGWLTILAEEVGAWKQVVTMDMGLERVKPPASLTGKPTVCLALSRHVAATGPGAGGGGGGDGGRGPPAWVRVHKSAPGALSGRVRGSYTFPRSKVSVQTLCRCDPDAPLRAEVVLTRAGGAGGERVLAQAPLSFRTLMEARRVPLTAPAPAAVGAATGKLGKVGAGRAPSSDSAHGGKELGAVVMNDVRVSSSATFLDYIMGGCEVNLVVAVDFTASNGDPTRPGTLHHIGGMYGPNEYEVRWLLTSFLA